MSAIPGLVFSSGLDGRLRAYSAGDGRIVWDVDTKGDYQTVNGVAAKGIPAVCGQRAKPSCRPELRTMRSWRPEIVAIQICVGSSAA